MGWSMVLLSALLMQSAPTPERAGWPMPAAAQRFIDALLRHDIEDARAGLPEDAAITSTLNNRGELPATLADARAYLTSCHSYFARTVRDLENPRILVVDINWDCPGQIVTPMLLTTIDGRLVAVRVGGGIPSIARYQIPIEALTNNFLFAAVADLTLAPTDYILAPNMTVWDARSARSVSLAEMISYVEGCGLRGISRKTNNEASASWDCPGGERVIVIKAENDRINRVELGRPNP
jgi:hypothetical protein